MPVLLALLFPSLAAVAQRLILLAALAGLGFALQKALESSRSGNLYERLRGLVDARRIIATLLPALAIQAALEERAALLDSQTLALETDTASKADQELQTLLQTSFATREEIIAASNQLAALLLGQSYSRALYNQVQLHFSQEFVRIVRGITVKGAAEAPDLVTRLVSQPPLSTQDELNLYTSQVASAQAQGWITDAAAERLWSYIANVQRALKVGEPKVITPPVVVTTPPAVTVPAGVSAEVATLIAVLQGQVGLQVQTGQATVAQLQALNVTIAGAAVTSAQPRTGTFDIPGLGTLGAGLAAVLGGIGIGSLAGSLTSALRNTANARGHAAQAGRFESSGTWVNSLMQYMGGALPLLIGGGGLLFQSALGPTIRSYASEAFSNLADIPGATAENIEANATENAAARFAQALDLGTKAQILSYSLEALGSVKYMGFNQIAGLIGEFAGFGRIAGGVMGTIENAAIYQPLRWKANRQYRPTLPGEGTVSTLFAKRLIDAERHGDFLARAGVPEEIIQLLQVDAYRELSSGEVANILRIQDMTDEEITHRVEFNRYAPDDVATGVLVTRMAALRREQLLRFTTVLRAYRQGFYGDARARAEIESARTPAPFVEYRLAVMSLAREVDNLEDVREMVLATLRKEVISPSEASTQLVALGMDGERVRIDMLRARIGLLTSTRGLVVSSSEAAGDQAGEEQTS